MNPMTQSYQSYPASMFIPMKPLNMNIGTLKLCEKHKKPLSFYNKYKPEKEPVCIDCLIEEAKELNPPNLFLPYSNLEQDYFFQKKSLLQIIDQANNIKKYEKHIINFQQLMIRYFSQFINKFIKEKILLAASKSQKGIELFEKYYMLSANSSQEIMNALNKFENEKFILENKSADVFCQINKLQQLFLKNHPKIESNFKDLLYECFEEKDEINLDSNEKSYSNQNNSYLYKTQSNKKNPNLMNCVNMENTYNLNANSAAPCNPMKINQESNSSSKSSYPSPNLENLNPYTPNEKQDINFNEIKSNSSDINLNMEKERVFEESPHKKEPKENLPKSNETQEFNKKREEDNVIYRAHKEKINNLIEKDKSKKINQSFYQPKKSTMKKRPKTKMNKPFPKFNYKYGHSKKVEYKQYNQFIQRTCNQCGASFTALENSGKNEYYCRNCRPNDEEENKSNRIMNRRDSSFKREGNNYIKYGYRSNNFNSQKKKYGPPSQSSRFWTKGKNNFNKMNKDLSFNSHRFGSKTLHHSNSNFANRHNNRMTSPKPFLRNKKFGLGNLNSKFKSNKDKDNFGVKKYNEKNLNDDFEVELNSVEESEDNDSEEESEKKNEKSFSKNANNLCRSEGDKSNENDNNSDDFDNNDDNKNEFDDDKDEIKEDENNQEDDDNQDEDFDVDF